MNTSLNALIADIKTLFATLDSSGEWPTQSQVDAVDRGLLDLLDPLFSEADTVLVDRADYPKQETTGPVVDAEKIGINRPVPLVHKDAWDHTKGQMKETDAGWTNPENVLVDSDYQVVEVKKPTVWALLVEWDWGEDDQGSCFKVCSTRDLAIASLGDYLQDNWLDRMNDQQGEVGQEEPEAENLLTEEDIPPLNNIDDIEAAAEEYFDAMGGYELCRLGEVEIDGDILTPVEIEHG